MGKSEEDVLDLCEDDEVYGRARGSRIERWRLRRGVIEKVVRTKNSGGGSIAVEILMLCVKVLGS